MLVSCTKTSCFLCTEFAACSTHVQSCGHSCQQLTTFPGDASPIHYTHTNKRPECRMKGRRTSLLLIIQKDA